MVFPVHCAFLITSTVCHHHLPHLPPPPFLNDDDDDDDDNNNNSNNTIRGFTLHLMRPGRQRMGGMKILCDYCHSLTTPT